ncbi:TPA: glycosyltransferase family 2 protein [Klebsiella pneumoniae]|nr:glycosyltransferase family 2 protein [Klebsiella pneumoniae]
MIKSINDLFLVIKKIPRAIRKRMFILKYMAVNIGFISRKKSKTNNNVVVSLTTHGKRIKTVYLTIESILDGCILPKKIYLWLDDDVIYKNLPKSLLNIKDCRFEVKLSNNYGPHTKYFPYILMQDFTNLLVTADDDILYPAEWLSMLVSANLAEPDKICCYRAHKICFRDEFQMSNYNEWDKCLTVEPSFCNFATGVSGVIYPKEFQLELYNEGTGFIQKCLKADDVWLHFIAVKYDFKIKQIQKEPIHFPIINNTQDVALFNSNVLNNHNQEQINMTYNPEEISKIYSDFLLYKHNG